MNSPLLIFGNVISLLAMFAISAFGHASTSMRVPVNLHHTSWTGHDGAPPLILSMTQTKDGWLWLGGPTGLYRFDGMQFELFSPSNAPLLTRNVSVVNALADGSLWVGYRTGGAARLQHGRIRNYGEQDGLPSRAVWGVEQDGDGRLWAATGQGMYYLENSRWRAAGNSWALPGGGYKTLMRDRRDVLWAQGDAGVFALRRGDAQFNRVQVSSGTGVLFELPDGGVVSWDAARGHFNQLAPGRSARPKEWALQGDPNSLLFDHRGDLWIGHKYGLEIRTANNVSRSGPAQSLNGASVSAIFEDKERNIWVATATGIDRFRSRRLVKIELPESAIGAAILADDSGGAWIGGFHVSASDAGQTTITPLWPARREGWSDMLTSFTRTDDGTLWGASFGALRRIQGKDSRIITLPPAMGNMVITNVLAERNGDLLAAVQQLGLFRRKPDGEWLRAANEAEVNVMARSGLSGVWLACYPGRIAHIDGNHWRRFDQSDGLALGLVMALHVRGQHVWAGGDNGLALFGGQRFNQVKGVNGQNFDGISGIVEMDNGDVWLNASAGLFRIPGEEIEKFKRLPEYRARFERLDELDGLEGSAPRVIPSPSLVLASDGHLWVVRSTGVFRLDPAAAIPPAPVQPAIIKTIGPPGAGGAAQGHAQFAPGVSALQIDYTIPSLAMPERVRFRYRLDEVDSAWQDVGNRRSAYYSNLAPGDYIFRVAASDYAGKWPDQHTSLRFSIAPAMTQTWWFKTLCAVLLSLVAYRAYRWHINRLAMQMAQRLEERVRERERIARELHDTLLQSIQSLILHIHAAVMKLPPKDMLRLQLEAALQHADDVVDEGRGRIRELRGEDEKLSFADAVLAAAARLQPRDASAIELQMSGTPRQLDGTIYREALAIVTEAIANAYSHAGATLIEVALHFGAREFRCIVRDDGVGIPAAILGQGGREDHWGMRGMAERAARISARLAVRSTAETGTEWQLALTSELAYPH